MIYYERCNNIWIDGSSTKSPAQYESAVVARLDQILNKQTGRALLRAIAANGKSRNKKVRIIPYTEDDEDNAVAVPVDGWEGRDAAPAGATVYRGGTDDPTTKADERFETTFWKGLGLGSNVDLEYNPDPKDPTPVCPRDGKTTSGPCRLVWGVADHGKDDQLLHELVHAMREGRGQLNQVPTENSDYDNEEEFFAILIANIYLSEQGKKFLRADHHGFAVLSADLNSSEKFLGKGISPPSRAQLENRRLVGKLCTEDWIMCQEIGDFVNADFNPIREYLRKSELYPTDPRQVYFGGK